jgi:hypothetical protein
MGLCGMAMGSYLQSCGPSLTEVNKDADQVNLECNPILPLPKRGCYTGTNKQWFTAATEDFPKKYGIPAAFNAAGSGIFWVSNGDFPREGCEWLIDKGIVPVIRYVTVPQGYHLIIEGKFDEAFKKWANAAAEFAKPIVLLPWQCVNEPRQNFKIWWWSQADPKEYIAAWVRMHDIFSQEGANHNVIWSTKLINWGFTPQLRALDPFAYLPEKDYVDLLGWNCNSNLVYNGGLSFESMFRSDYIEACRRYPTKPQVLWELGAEA